MSELPVKVAKSSRMLLNQLCTDFITFVTKTASEVCTTERKAVINPDHVIAALHRSQRFADYTPKCAETKTEAKQKVADRRYKRSKSKNFGKHNDMTEEQLLAHQEELMEAARRQCEAEDQKLQMEQTQVTAQHAGLTSQNQLPVQPQTPLQLQSSLASAPAEASNLLRASSLPAAIPSVFKAPCLPPTSNDSIASLGPSELKIVENDEDEIVEVERLDFGEENDEDEYE